MDISNYQAKPGSLNDRVILITGAGSGIGKAVAIDCAKAGATVLLLSRTLEHLETVYDEIEALNAPQPALLHIDMEQAGIKEYEEIANSIQKEYGRLDGLLHNAGRVNALTQFQHIELSTWSQLITLHIHAPFLLTRTCLPLLEASKDPSVLFTIDDATRAYWGAYGVAKHAQQGFLKILADELDGDIPVRVNGINPGPVRTPLRTHHYPGINPNTLVGPEAVTESFLFYLGADSRGHTGEIHELQGEDTII